MNNINYRNLVKEDYEEVKRLINEAFGFSEFIADKKFLNSMLNLYLQSCILESSYSKVAVKNGKLIGIILGSASKDKNRLRKAHNILSTLYSICKLFLLSWKNWSAIKAFIKINKTYKEIISEKKDEFDGALQLFIVSENARGLGIGKTLLNYLLDYMKQMSVKHFYLYTDDRCNYKFYDSQNFDKINQKEICFNSFKERLNVFLYSYKFN